MNLQGAVRVARVMVVRARVVRVVRGVRVVRAEGWCGRVAAQGGLRTAREVAATPEGCAAIIAFDELLCSCVS
jgi:hypothetical protein